MIEFVEQNSFNKKFKVYHFQKLFLQKCQLLSRDAAHLGIEKILEVNVFVKLDGYDEAC